MITKKEKQLTIELLTEKLERISGKKVIFEGTWATPDTPEKLEQAKMIIASLIKIKDKAYEIFGNDDFFDGMDRAISNGKGVIKNLPENE